MRRDLQVFAALSMSLTSSAVVPSLKASELDERTITGVCEPIAVEGAVLLGGQFALRPLAGQLGAFPKFGRAIGL
jgi:hypothetical protein